MTLTRSGLQSALFIALALGLTGCQTMNETMGNMKRGFSTMFQGKPADDAALAAAPAQTQSCLPIRIVEDLAFTHQFLDETTPREDNRISSATIASVTGDCKETETNRVASLAITFNGALGPKGTAIQAQNPAFAYPYFIALTKKDGTIIAKEVFAISLTYQPGQTTVTHVENISQMIPTNGALENQASEILIGFQLKDKQLVYNRTLLDAGKPATDRGLTPVASTMAATEKAKDEPKKPVKKKKKVKPPTPQQKPDATAAAAPVAEPAPSAIPADVPASVEETPDAATSVAPAVAPADTGLTTPAVEEAPAEPAVAPVTAPAAPVGSSAESTAAPIPAMPTAPVVEPAPVPAPAAPSTGTGDTGPTTTPKAEALDELFDLTIPEPKTTP